MEVLQKYDRLWARFTPHMRAAFISLAKNDGLPADNIQGKTRGALRRHQVIMQTIRNGHVRIFLNWRGCELLDYLRITRQISNDGERVA